jgi:hypothetical protein
LNKRISLAVLAVVIVAVVVVALTRHASTTSPGASGAPALSPSPSPSPAAAQSPAAGATTAVAPRAGTALGVPGSSSPPTGAAVRTAGSTATAPPAGSPTPVSTLPPPAGSPTPVSTVPPPAPPVASVSVSCPGMQSTMKLGATFSMTYVITLKSAGNLGLGAALYDPSGNDQADGTGDEDQVSFPAGSSTNTRAVHIPTNLIPGTQYDVWGELWPANFIGDGSPVASGRCGFVTVTG